MQEKMPCIFQESPGFESQILGAPKQFCSWKKNWADWCVAVVQKAGERRGFFSGIVCRFLCE